MNKQTPLKAAVDSASAEYEADIYFYSGGIDDEGFGLLTKEVSDKKSRDKAILILVTNGGLANSAYQIARLFQRLYEEFVVYCPSKCKSAGTLVAVGAHRLIMDVFSELGPLDVQLLKQNEIAARKSGLLSHSSFDALADASFELYERLMISITLKSGGLVGFKLASELSASMASTLLAPVYAQVNPDVVGSENRDLNIATQYGIRLVQHSGNAGTETVLQLVHGYPSHDFIIDNDEASQLFNNVEEPSESLYKIVSTLGDIAYDESVQTVVCALTSPVKDTKHDKTGTEGKRSNALPAGNDDTAKNPVDGSGEGDRASNPKPPPEAGDGIPPDVITLAPKQRKSGDARDPK